MRNEAVVPMAREASAAGEEPQTCPLCQSSASELHVLPHTIAWECEAADCKLRFAAPQASGSELRAAYRSLYYPDLGHRGAPACEGTPDEIHRELVQHLIERGQLDRAPRARLLDYGCGKGCLGGVAVEFGLQVVGIEQDPHARLSASRGWGLRVFEDIEHLLSAEPGAKFDAIVLWQVIEHLRQPSADLESLRNLLTPAGCLVVATPNSDCLKARLQGASWENFSNPTHFYYFTDVSLSRLIGRSGLEVVDRLHLPSVYPHHSILRGYLQRLLRSCRLNGELLFVLRPVAGRGSVQARSSPGR